MVTEPALSCTTLACSRIGAMASEASEHSSPITMCGLNWSSTRFTVFVACSGLHAESSYCTWSLSPLACDFTCSSARPLPSLPITPKYEPGPEIGISTPMRITLSCAIALNDAAAAAHASAAMNLSFIVPPPRDRCGKCTIFRMDLGLKDKIVLITGGSKGIGFAAAQAFVAEGARVAIASRSQDNLDKACASCAGLQGFAADLTLPRAAAQLVDAVERRLGAIDVLVNCAGAAKRTNADDLTPDAWRASMDAKYFSYIHVIDPLIKRMAARGHGAIVNVIGSGGKVATPTHISGGAANAALMLATAGLASAYASKGVRVIGINPGPTKTDRVAAGLAAEAKRDAVSVDEALKRSVARMPMQRMPEPAEIADIIVFAASERAGMLTGAILSADAATNPTVV